MGCQEKKTKIMKVLQEKLQCNMGLIRWFFAGSPILHFLVCVLRVREIPRHVPLYITLVSDLSLTLATV